MGRFLIPVTSEADERALAAGGKAWNTFRLVRMPGVRTPRSFVLLADAFDYFVRKNFKRREIVRLIDNYLKRNVRAPLFAKLAHAPFPLDLEEEIIEGGAGSDLVMVRSSGVFEDSAATSLAGHYESMVSRTERSELLFTVKSCWLVGLRVFLDHILQPDGAVPPLDAIRSLALLFQEIVDAERSGIYFSQSPVHPGCALVTANWGTCHSAVDGRMACDSFVLEKGRVVSRSLRHKFEMTIFHWGPRLLPGETVKTALGGTSVHFPYGRYLYTARVPVPKDGAPALEARHIVTLNETAARVKDAMGCEIDMEWSFSRDSLYVLQVRPITTEAPVKRLEAEGRAYVIASPGTARGPVRIVLSPSDIRKVSPGDIIAVQATDPEFMPILYRASGIVAEDGSPLCHTAIVARELKIPCILGYRGATSGAFTEGEVITVDADRGIVTRRAARAKKKPMAMERDGVVYDVGHLRLLDHGARPVIAASALLHGFFCASGWADPAWERVSDYIEELKAGSGLKEIRVLWDINDDRRARPERDPLLAELKELFACRE
jgi:pyruvate,water dikinase